MNRALQARFQMDMSADISQIYIILYDMIWYDMILYYIIIVYI